MAGPDSTVGPTPFRLDRNSLDTSRRNRMCFRGPPQKPLLGFGRFVRTELAYAHLSFSGTLARVAAASFAFGDMAGSSVGYRFRRSFSFLPVTSCATEAP